MSKVSEAIGKFEKVAIGYDHSTLSEDVKRALPHLKMAMDGFTRIFLRQQMEGLPEIYDEVMTGNDEEKREFFKLFLGPWGQLENYESFFPEFEKRPPTCAFYPKDLTKDEWDAALKKMNASEYAAATDHYTVVTREGGKLKSVPYHLYFAKELAEIFDHIEAAADIVENEDLKRYLYERAEGLVSGNYRDSEAKWVMMKNVPIEPVFGPFEVYADNFMGIKATYEGFLLVVDQERTACLEEIEKNVSWLAKLFPEQLSAKSAVGGLAPMVVVNQIYTGGEAAQGVMASAFNLPNDVWVRENYGWKQIMIYNIMKAKFETCTVKIAEKISRGKIKADFEPYFYLVLMHELSHGLGPAYRTGDVPVSKALGERYSAVEEAKADVGGLHILLKSGGKYGVPKFSRERIFNSFFAGLFRSMRFGVHEAHGAANIIEYSWLKEAGVIKVLENGDFDSDLENLEGAVAGLLQKLCAIEAEASPEEAGDFIKQYGSPSKDIIDALEKLTDIPVDIRVEYLL